jgi:hypothetical protein
MTQSKMEVCARGSIAAGSLGRWQPRCSHAEASGHRASRPSPASPVMASWNGCGAQASRCWGSLPRWGWAWSHSSPSRAGRTCRRLQSLATLPSTARWTTRSRWLQSRLRVTMRQATSLLIAPSPAGLPHRRNRTIPGCTDHTRSRFSQPPLPSRSRSRAVKAPQLRRRPGRPPIRWSRTPRPPRQRQSWLPYRNRRGRPTPPRHRHRQQAHPPSREKAMPTALRRRFPPQRKSRPMHRRTLRHPRPLRRLHRRLPNRAHQPPRPRPPRPPPMAPAMVGATRTGTISSLARAGRSGI